MNEIYTFRDYVKKSLRARSNGVYNVNMAGSSTWVRLSSGVDSGLVISSNQAKENFNGMYGTTEHSGTIGYDFNSKPIIAGGARDVSYQTAPGISSVEIEENTGDGGMARQCNFSIKCFNYAQLDVLKKYFFEYGNAVFVEWGTLYSTNADGFLSNFNIPKPSVDNISKHFNFSETKKIRESCNGQYDCYLGFITGGGFTVDDGEITLSVKLVGLGDLPGALKTYTSNKKEDGIQSKVTFTADLIAGESRINRKRFMYMFNDLPSALQSVDRYKLVNNEYITSLINFINFQSDIKEKINSNVSSNESFKDVKNKDTKIPSSYKAITDQRYIRFGMLIELLNVNGVSDRFYINGTKVNSMKIDTSKTIILAFNKIFSTDPSALFIPNRNTPTVIFADLIENASDSNIDSTDYKYFLRNQVEYGKYRAEFPSNVPIVGGITTKNTATGDDTNFSVKMKPEATLDIDAREWGFLDDLYINFDLVKRSFSGDNINITQSLYMILNAISRAAGNLWDFQIIEDEENNLITIIDRNLFLREYKTDFFNFEAYGVRSILTSLNFSAEMTKEHMNQIIGQKMKNGAKINTTDSSVIGKTISQSSNDKVLQKIEILRHPQTVDGITVNSNPPSKQSFDAYAAGVITAKASTEQTPEQTKAAAAEKEKIKAKNQEMLLNSFTFCPRINISTIDTNGFNTVNGDFNIASAYQISINDAQYLKSLKDQFDENLGLVQRNLVSPVLPIDIEFTIPGISGIRRWDSFTMTGLPTGYGPEYGFWQVTGISHSIDDAWMTTIKAKWRQQIFNSK